MDELRDPIFKGCTRPAMKMGVPLAPLVFSFLGCFLFAVWGMFFFKTPWPLFMAVVLFIVLLVTMQRVVKKDDQRFRQIGLWLRLRLANVNRRYWGATSYSPIRFKRR